MEIRILGPLQAGEDGQLLELGPPKQRALLALLALHRNEVVSADLLIDELWAGRPPAAAAKSIQVYVSQLRKSLGASAIESQAGGYMLSLEADIDRFERLASEGRELLGRGESRQAADVLRSALALWRGPPLADVAYESFAQSEIARLEELRLSTLEARIDADLAEGRQAELVAELQQLVRDNPLRERLLGQLMLALYRTGRQAEALEAYRNGRRMLKDELGLEPSRELQELEQAILRQDEALGPAARARIRPPARRSYLLGAGAVLAVVVAAALAVGLTRGGGQVAVAPSSLAVVNPATNKIVGDVKLNSVPTSVAAGDGSVWVTSSQDKTLFRIDPKASTIVKTIALPGAPANVAVGAGAVWLPYLVRPSDAQAYFAGDSALLRIDPRHGYLQQTIDTSQGFSVGYDDAVAANETGVWVVDPPGVVTWIDPATTTVAGRWFFLKAYAVTLGYGSAWVLTNDGIARISPAHGSSPQTISLGSTSGGTSPSARGIAAGAGAIWTANFLQPVGCFPLAQHCRLAGNVFRIDPGSNLVEAKIGGAFREPGGAGYGAGSLWVIDDRALFRVDPKTNRVVAKISLPRTPVGVAAGKDGVWVAVGTGK
jgi:DNA-binding SARP family transcriptional activator/streptogramin lyase